MPFCSTTTLTQVMKGIVVCTTAGTTAEWWFNRTEVGSPTWSAFKRSCTTSLGAIAFGSFFVAIIQTICYVLDKAKKYISRMPGVGSEAKLIIKLTTCCLHCLQKCIEIFNFYVYVVSRCVFAVLSRFTHPFIHP
jgi:hypothetical protein